MDRDGLLIGEVAKRSGISRKAVRLYEARGILLPAHRTPSGYPSDQCALWRSLVRGVGLAPLGPFVADAGALSPPLAVNSPTSIPSRARSASLALTATVPGGC